MCPDNPELCPTQPGSSLSDRISIAVQHRPSQTPHNVTQSSDCPSATTSPYDHPRLFSPQNLTYLCLPFPLPDPAPRPPTAARAAAWTVRSQGRASRGRPSTPPLISPPPSPPPSAPVCARLLVRVSQPVWPSGLLPQVDGLGSKSRFVTSVRVVPCRAASIPDDHPFNLGANISALSPALTHMAAASVPRPHSRSTPSNPAGPTTGPSQAPTATPSRFPSKAPSGFPTVRPTHQPTTGPTRRPTTTPSRSPTALPTAIPDVVSGVKPQDGDDG
jgi:hypothetical protein